MKKIFILIFLLWPALAAAQPAYEKPPELKASQILPPELVVGPNHKVEENVESDGFLFHYTIDSQWGQLEAVSTPTLKKRVHELNAMAEMEQLKGTQEFKHGVEQMAGKLVSGAENLVTDPGGSVKKIGKGIGGLFKSVGGVFTGKGSEHGSTEGNTLERVSGFSKTERQYAQRFDVDPYSRNELLQKELSDVSKAGFLGSTITSMGLGQVVGRAAGLISAAGDVSDLVHTNSPDQLREINRKKLEAMEVDKDVIDLFTKNTNFTITEQTAIVEALTEMDGVDGRADFVKFAVLTDSPVLANFRTLQAHLYSVYTDKWQKLQQFVHFGDLACAQAIDGTIVVAAPVDDLFWTEQIAEHINTLNGAILETNPDARRVLWIVGDFSPRAEKEMKNLGWELRPRALEKIKD